MDHKNLVNNIPEGFEINGDHYHGTVNYSHRWEIIWIGRWSICDDIFTCNTERYLEGIHEYWGENKHDL